MNPTSSGAADATIATPIPSPEGAFMASALQEGYAERARQSTSCGAKTDDYERAAREYEKNPDILHGARPPSQAISREQPVHVLMCYMQAGGKSIKEIAESTGYSEGAVKVISKQPWFRKRFLRITAEAGRNQVEAFLANETLSSLETLVEIRDKPEEKGATRVAAANSILDRALGKPTQKVETENHNYDHKAATTASELDRQIANAEAELKAIGQSSTTSSGSN